MALHYQSPTFTDIAQVWGQAEGPTVQAVEAALVLRIALILQEEKARAAAMEAQGPTAPPMPPPQMADSPAVVAAALEQPAPPQE